MAVHNNSPSSVLILLAPGFEEIVIIYLLTAMREMGLQVSLVGLTAGLVNGLYGLAVRPDYSFEQLKTGMPYQLIIIPGGRQCTSSLVTDPRVHRLLDATLRNSGYVAATSTAEPILTQIGIPELAESSRFIVQRDMEIGDFTDGLLNLLSGW